MVENTPPQESFWQGYAKDGMEFFKEWFDNNLTLLAESFTNPAPSPNMVIFPTETVWGLGACALDNNENRLSLDNIYELKGREKTKPFSILLSNARLINKIACPTPQQKELLENIILAGHLFLGKLSLVLPYDPNNTLWKLAPHCYSNLDGGQAAVCLRLPCHPLTRFFLQAIEQRLGSPLAVTSVNISGQKNEVKNITGASDFINIHPDFFPQTPDIYPFQSPIIHSFQQIFSSNPSAKIIHPTPHAPVAYYFFIRNIIKPLLNTIWPFYDLGDSYDLLSQPISFAELFADIDKKLMADKRLHVGQPSTVLSLLGDKPTILRHGAASKNEIESTLNINID